MDSLKREIALELSDIGAIKFGQFKLKSGQSSPVYFDLRVIISLPHLMEKISACLSQLVHNLPATVDLICGVPYAALPIATCVALKERLSMVMCRKEAKSHGTKRRIEGVFYKGQECVVIEDVITSGSSVADATEALRCEGICVSHSVVIVDREQGGRQVLEKQNHLNVISLFKVTELLDILFKENRLTEFQRDEVLQYIRNPSSKFSVPETLGTGDETCSLDALIARKETKLCVALDTSDPDELLHWADQFGAKVCVVKVHLDILTLESRDPELIIESLLRLAKRHGFLIMEDRKLADIGETVRRQLTDGHFHVASWCDFVTVHSIPGHGVFSALRDANLKVKQLRATGSTGGRPLQAVVVAEMSSQGTLAHGDYVTQCMELCRANHDVVAGIVCQNPPAQSYIPPEEKKTAYYWVPGVNAYSRKDKLGQQYNRPADVRRRFEAAVSGPKSEVIIIVGRGITAAPNPLDAVEEYRLASVETD